MARWSEIVAAEPEFARQVQMRFAVNASETIATLRKDGSPRISGVDVVFRNGDLLFLDVTVGSMRASDLRRDPRLALHSPTTTATKEDLSDWPGDAKIAGCGIETVIEPDRGLTGFRVDATEVARTYLEADHLVIESWHERRGLQRRKRWYPLERRVKDATYWRQTHSP